MPDMKKTGIMDTVLGILTSQPAKYFYVGGGAVLTDRYAVTPLAKIIRKKFFGKKAASKKKTAKPRKKKAA